MQIVLLSGGSGSRLWPLSNDARSKQFLRLLNVNGSDTRESMIQRVYRQLKSAGMSDYITVATSAAQRDSVIAQLGSQVDIVTEPSRRDTFPAICLACEYLSKKRHCGDDEVIVVMPCDPYTGDGYFEVVRQMAQGVSKGEADMIVMGIRPTYSSAKYGYITPVRKTTNLGEIVLVKQFVEKPDVVTAQRLIESGSLWNGGVFVFKLGYLRQIARKYADYQDFDEVVANYGAYPKISFDYEVAEKVDNIGMIEYGGEWKDLGTWNTLTDEINDFTFGNVICDDSISNTHVFNELHIPLLCLGTHDLVIAASPDGIIVAEKSKSENVKHYVSRLKHRPMYEERRWGTYKVIDNIEFPDGFCALTKQLTLNPGCSISYQRHTFRDEVWTFICGHGEIVLDGERKKVGRGDTIVIPKGVKHALRASDTLTFIEVQKGQNLVEDDIERFAFDW